MCLTRVKKPWALIVVLIVVIALAAPQNVSALDAAEIIMDSVLNFDCLDWSIVGGCLWLCIEPPWVTIKATIKVKHRNPELIVGAWHANGNSDWSFLDTMSPAVAWSLDGGAASSGGQAAGKAHSSLKFKNIAAVGSPAAALTSLWKRPEMVEHFSIKMNWRKAWQGACVHGRDRFGDPCNPADPGELFPAEDGSKKPIVKKMMDYVSNPPPMPPGPPGISGPLPAPRINSRIINVGGIHGLGGIGGRVGGQWRKVFSWVLCPNNASPLVPYHTTAMDPAWRLPMVEVPMVLMHPLQSTGGSKRLFPRLYPRVGFVKTSQDYKAGFAAARRSLDLVYTNRAAMAHVALRVPSSGSAGQWPPQLNDPWVYQQIAPTSHGCQGLPDRTESTVGATDGYSDRISENGSYTWQTWRYYKCCKKPGNCWMLFDFG